MAIEREGAKPILKQVGPFTYKVALKKYSIRNNHNGTLSFRERKTWTFEKSMSIADEDLIIFTLNTPLALTLTLIQSASPGVRVLITLALDAVTEGFFIKRTVKQLLFNGYNDLLTTFGPILNPEIPNNNRFGYFYQKNNSDDGEYTVYNGVDNLSQLNLINLYNGKASLNYWTNDECNSLNGTTNGQIVPPLKDVETPENIKLFVSELCRTLQMRFTSNHQPYPGLTVKRFTFDVNNFASSIEYPPNNCFISKLPSPQQSSLLFPLTRPQNSLSPSLAPNLSPSPSPSSSSSSSSSPMSGNRGLLLSRQAQNNQPQFIKRKSPFPSGVFDLSSCRYGAPLIVSQPHFLNSDPIYRQSVVGMSPDYLAHAFWMDVDPMTGSVVNMAARMQLNIAITKSPGLFRYRNIPDIVFPIFWQEYLFQLTPDLAQILVDAREMPYVVSSISFYSLLSLGLIIMMSAFLVYAIPYLKTHTLDINKQIQVTANGISFKKVR